MALTARCALRRSAEPTQSTGGETALRHGEDREVRALPLLARTLRATARAVVRCQPAACFTHPRHRSAALRQVCTLFSLDSIVLIAQSLYEARI